MLPLRRSHFAIAEVCEVEDSDVACSVLAFLAQVTMMTTTTTTTFSLLLLLFYH
jgi:hypothetical protein